MRMSKKKEARERAQAAYQLMLSELGEQLLAAEPGSEAQLRLAQSIKTLAEAKELEKGPSLTPDKALASAVTTAQTVAVAGLDRHIPLVGKAWAFVTKLKI